MNIVKASIESNKIKFEGIEVQIPNHLSNLKIKNFNLGIRASDIELNDKILEDTGVAILAGSYFGLSDKTFTARLSYVDFKGEDIINNQLNDSEILEICSKTLEGCKILTDYIENL